jgi:hypothetical protein
VIILRNCLPRIKGFLKHTGWDQRTQSFALRLMVAFLMRCGRMSASQAAGSLSTEPRHRAAVTRFLARADLAATTAHQHLVSVMLNFESRRRGRWLFLLDQTLVGHQGEKTENTFSTGNRKRQPRKGRRYNKYKHARRSCHCFVMGLLITPSGYRLPFHRCFYTKPYCAQRKRPFHTQTQLAAELVRQLPVPEGTDVYVIGDTAFDAASIRSACAGRGFSWITPVNPERVLAGEKPRPKVRSLLQDIGKQRFAPVRLVPGQGPHAAQRRVARCRLGPKVKARTFYAHRERLTLHSVGKVQLVFSTKEKPQPGKRLTADTCKILMTNNLQLSTAEIVTLYDLRWQIELFFKELKSELGFHQYRLRRFEQVENWTQLCLLTFLYLEWYRAGQLARRGQPVEAKRWWLWQRTHGLRLAVRQRTEQAELEKLSHWTATSTGLKKLKRVLRAAHPREYQVAL